MIKLITGMNNSSVGILSDSTLCTESTQQEKKNVVPLMIGQIKRSSGELKVWGMPVHILTVIGVLHKLEISKNKITYEIEDETGAIKCFRWLESHGNIPKLLAETNTYVRVYGHLCNEDEQQQIFALCILPLEDLNELTNHLLEVTYVTLKARQIAASSNTDPNLVDNHNLFNNNMTDEQVTVFNVIKNWRDSEDGIERCDIKRRVPPRILLRVDDIIDFLQSEGLIYSTITNDYFKAI